MSPEQIQNVKNLLNQELGLGSLPEPLQERVFNELAQNAVIAIARVTEESLPKESIPQYEALQTSGTSESMQHFLESQIPNYNSLVQQAVTRVVAEHKAATQ